ncbi:Uncharacterised protein [Shigella sonnei]|nr:Uncharacterised protein [Shigella sonnei]
MRDIRIGPGLEGKGNCHATGGIAGGGHIHQVIDTIHILFDNLRHRILHGLRISTWIVCLNRNRRRCNGWILSDGQL